MSRFALFPVVILVLLAASPSNACSCLYQDASSPEVVREALDQADAVFLGVADSVEVQSVPDGEYGPKIQTTIFAIVDSWKGEPSERISTRVNIQCCLCGFSFRPGQTYVVFAKKSDDGSYSVSICSLTRTLAEADDILRLLNEFAAE